MWNRRQPSLEDALWQLHKDFNTAQDMQSANSVEQRKLTRLTRQYANDPVRLQEAHEIRRAADEAYVHAQQMIRMTYRFLLRVEERYSRELHEDEQRGDELRAMERRLERMGGAKPLSQFPVWEGPPPIVRYH